MTQLDRPTLAISATPFRARLGGAELVSLLVVRIGGERFGLDLAAVQEAVDVGSLDRMPKLPHGALGVTRWRGAARTVWSAAAPVRVTLERGLTVLFLRAGSAHVAVAVDDAEDLVTLPGSAIRPVGGVDDGAGLVLGVVRVGETLVTVLDAELLARRVRPETAQETPGTTL